MNGDAHHHWDVATCSAVLSFSDGDIQKMPSPCRDDKCVVPRPACLSVHCLLTCLLHYSGKRSTLVD